MRTTSLRRRGVILVALLLGICRLQAAVWTGGGGNADWFDPANWDPADVPGAGAAVTNATGTILVTNETAELASFTLTGGSVTFSNWTTRLRATEVDLQGGTLTLPPPFANDQMSNRVWIVCTDFTLSATAKIDVNGKGYLGSQGPGAAADAERPGGGSYGGQGGYGEKGGPVAVYGTPHQPLQPGSGGGYGITRGGAGGGAVLIEAAGNVAIAGQITAKGQDYISGYAGGGSGGAIFIACNEFDGSAGGLLQANGGNGQGATSGGGGGGRIAVDYASLQGTPTLRFAAAAGTGYYNGSTTARGYFPLGCWGTLSIPDATLLTVAPSNGRFDQIQVYFRNTTAPTVSALTIIGNRLLLATPGLDLTIAGDLTVGTNAEFGVGAIFGDANTQLTVDNNLFVTNGGIFSVHSGIATSNLDGFGAQVEVAGTLHVGALSWVQPHSHATNGASVRFIVDSLNVASGGGFNAYARGYAGQYGPAPGIVGQNTSRGSGGDHGGRGGSPDSFRIRLDNVGVLDHPVEPGSGGYEVTASGGGLVYIEAVNAAIAGTINANGASGGALGGGAGGAIVIDCTTLSGQSPEFTADGGDGSSGLGGGGGGGRIALHYESITNLTAPRFHARGGVSVFNTKENNAWQLASGEGTVWFSTPELLSTTIDGDRFRDIRVYAKDFTAWTVSSLTISNSDLTLGADGFVLNVAGDVTVGPKARLGLGARSGSARPVLNCGGNLTVGTNGSLYVYAGATNGVDVGLGAEVNVSGDLIIKTNGWVYPYSHELTGGGGGSSRFRAQSVTLEPGGGFKALGRGFQYKQGPGAGGSGGSGRGGGGGYGGPGGAHSATPFTSGGKTNGWATAPIFPGSGGGGGDTSGGGGGGGGCIWIETVTLKLNGVLNANGADCMGNGGGGAGGGILLDAQQCKVANTADIRANGGLGGSSHGGGGGGGRIALWLGVPTTSRALLLSGAASPPGVVVSEDPFSSFAVTPSVAGGIGFNLGDPGFVRFIDGRPRGTVILMR